MCSERRAWQTGRALPAAEFQKILDHSGVVWNCWTGALAHLGVARSNAMLAKAAKGADPDIPILKSARAEYGKLQ